MLSRSSTEPRAPFASQGGLDGGGMEAGPPPPSCEMATAFTNKREHVIVLALAYIISHCAHVVSTCIRTCTQNRRYVRGRYIGSRGLFLGRVIRMQKLILLSNNAERAKEMLQ